MQKSSDSFLQIALQWVVTSGNLDEAKSGTQKITFLTLFIFHALQDVPSFLYYPSLVHSVTSALVVTLADEDSYSWMCDPVGDVENDVEESVGERTVTADNIFAFRWHNDSQVHFLSWPYFLSWCQIVHF